jgi:uncharacterized protein YecT (DUF1311 family)
VGRGREASKKAGRGSGLAAGLARPASRSGVARAARSGLIGAALSAGLIGALAACGSGAASTSQAPAAPTASSPSAAAAPSASAAASAGTTAFVPIVEPFDPGHPARSRPAPAACGGQATAGAVRQCYEAKTENADVAIDAVQLARYQDGSATQRTTILAGDSAWLAARRPVCAAGFPGGGVTAQTDIAACLLGESTARLDGVRGITPPEAVLKATDNTDPRAWSWYTTPEGSRIAMVDTQGDGTGGAIIAWMIIGGADGFVVNPAQFYFSDGSFTDHGVVEPPDPSFHRVLPGTEYQFAIDYSHLSSDPSAAKGAGGYEYVPGAPVAIWK